MHIDGMVVKTSIRPELSFGSPEAIVTFVLRGSSGEIELQWPMRAAEWPRVGQMYRFTLTPLPDKTADLVIQPLI